MLGLTCYTAALHGYLVGEWDADAVLADSIRLAVLVDLPAAGIAFSHHEPSLDKLPDGTWLRYQGARTPRAALDAVTGEIARYGRAVVVADASRLPWSLWRDGPPTPHWLLVDGRGRDRWRVTDAFSAVAPAGTQLPYHDWLDTAELCAAMTLPARWSPQQDLRNALAFGAPVPVAKGGGLWLRRSEEAPTTRQSPGWWLSGDSAVLPFLAGYLAADHARLARHYDDLWAASSHRCFAYAPRLANAPTERLRGPLRAALARWADLPRVLRIAIESAERGRPRASLVQAAFDALLCAEAAVP